MPKHQKIKMVAWIKKLDMPIKNEVWKQTRNLYAQVMFKMMQQDKIQSPFDKNPPQGSLPRLNISDLPYPLRNKIVNKSKNKPVNRNLTQRSLNVKQNMTNNYKSFAETQQTKKPSRSPIQSKSQLNSTFKFSISDQIQESKRNITQRKSNYEQCSKIRQELEQNKLCLVLKRTLKFLSKNYEVLCDQTEYSSLLQDIVMVGDSRKYNLRDINSDCTPSPTRTVFKKCIRKIQQQIEKTSQENQYYLNCLKECKPK